MYERFINGKRLLNQILNVGSLHLTTLQKKRHFFSAMWTFLVALCETFSLVQGVTFVYVYL